MTDDLTLLEKLKSLNELEEDDDNGRYLLFPNADDDEYEEILMDMCFKED